MRHTTSRLVGVEQRIGDASASALREEVEQILREDDKRGYNLVTVEGSVEKGKTRYLLSGNGLASKNGWRRQRGSNFPTR